jgi:transposase
VSCDAGQAGIRVIWHFVDEVVMTEPILDDALWSLIQPLLPPPKPRRTRYPGRKPLDDRAVMAGILVVLESGIPWGQLPQEMGYGSGMSCWRRLRDWQQAGVWEQIHAVLMVALPSAGKIDWSRVVIESPSPRTLKVDPERLPIAPRILHEPPPRVVVHAPMMPQPQLHDVSEVS